MKRTAMNADHRLNPREEHDELEYLREEFPDKTDDELTEILHQRRLDAREEAYYDNKD